MNDSARIAELLDKQALHDNLTLYCRGADRGDVDLMKSTYWPDSTDEHGWFVGNGHDWCDAAVQVRRTLISCSHHLSNVYSEIDGNIAKRESMFIVVVHAPGETTLRMLGGRYRDLCERRDHVWKVLARICIWDWNRKSTDEPGWQLMRMPEISNWGQIYPSDPIYQDWRSSAPTAAGDSGRPEVSAWRATAS